MSASYNLHPYALNSSLGLILLLLQLLSARISNSNQYSIGNQILLDKDVIPFDEATLLLQEPGAVQVEHLGRIRIIGNSRAVPKFFPVRLSVYTKNSGNSTGIKTNPMSQCIGVSSTGSITCRKYEFDLNKLLPEKNPFRPNRRTIIVVPGYLSGDYVEWMALIRERWLELEDVNLILVHWPEGSNDFYESAVANIRLVSRQITIFLYYLAQLNNADFTSEEFRSSIYLVGHSLGAHVVGFVGQEMGGQVERITGLDPAGPVFDTLPREDRLNSDQAQFVDILHTNAGNMRYVKAGLGVIKKAANKVISKLRTTEDLAFSMFTNQDSNNNTAWFGIDELMGHMDYYANGGSIQPGCHDELHICDHKRAPLLYINALEYEIKFRHSAGLDSEFIRLGRHRLVAFPSADYKQFKTGVSLLRNCPELVTSSQPADMSDEVRFGAYKKCTVPIDFVTRAREFRRELEEDYGIQLDDHKDSRKYFFDTVSREPFVSEHYLLRLHMPPSSENQLKWSRGCKLLQISLAKDDLYSVIEYDSIDLQPTETSDFYGFTMPFANPTDWRRLPPMPAVVSQQLKLLGESTSNLEPLSENNDNLETYVPNRFWVGLTYNSPDGRLKRAMNSMSSMLSYSKIKKDTCQLVVEAIEVRPLVAIEHRISAWYLSKSKTKPPLVDSCYATLKNIRKFNYSMTLNSARPNGFMYLDCIGLKNQMILLDSDSNSSSKSDTGSSSSSESSTTLP